MAMTIAGTSGLTFNNSSTSTVGAVGDGQTWNAFTTATRVSGTTYTNSTGKPIQVCISFQASGSAQLTVVVQGVTIHNNTSGYSQGESFIVPNGGTYNITYTNVSNFVWAELR